MAAKDNNAVPDTPEDICQICWEPITNRSITDTCNHPFCLRCLTVWAQTHNLCPFCRRVFGNILANYRSPTDFQLIPLSPHLQPETPIDIPEDMVAINQLITQFRDVQRYNEFQERHYLNLMNRLNQLDPNSMQYLQNLQMIVNTEDRIENNQQLIQQLRNDLRIAIDNRQNQRLPNPQQIGNPQPMENPQQIGNPIQNVVEAQPVVQEIDDNNNNEKEPENQNNGNQDDQNSN